MVVLHPPQDAHDNVVGPLGTMSLNVEIAPELWRELTADGPTSVGLGQVLSGDVEWLAVAVWREFHRGDVATSLAIEETVSQLCGAIVGDRQSNQSLSTRRLTQCAEYLDDHLVPPPGLAEIARVVGVHPMHLAKLFRRRFGYSLGEFVRRRRVAWACGQLGDSGATVASIALAAGFADHAHFTRTFRRITGCTPSWYRDHLA